MPTRLNITPGTHYGRLTVLEEAPTRVTPCGTKKRYFKCICECGTIKEYGMSHMVNGKSQSCGCYRSELFKSIRGQLSPNWKGGRRLKDLVRDSQQYKERRKQCMERDNYTCQISGQRGGKLVVHHKKPFALIVDDLDYDTYLASEDLWNLDNGVTITEELHKQFHLKYGQTNFSEDDFEEFKGYINL